MDEMKDQLMDRIEEYYSIVQEMMMMMNKLLSVYHLQQMFEIYLKHVVMVVKYHWTEVFVMMIYYLDYLIYYLSVW
jgi:hypothetical protein